MQKKLTMEDLEFGTILFQSSDVVVDRDMLKQQRKEHPLVKKVFGNERN
jgi:hypothetical protein